MAGRSQSKGAVPSDNGLVNCTTTHGSSTVATTKISVSSKTSTEMTISSTKPVKETNRITIDYNPVSGRKTLNTYEIIRELGRGEHGRVKLGFDATKNAYVAIKLLNRKEKPKLGRPQGSSTEEKIHREIAILKKCSHPNIVRLIEVLDDEKSRKIYLVLEYCEKGEIRWQTKDGNPSLNREQARSVSRDVALGLEYLHKNNIIHRDIKPANLLVSDENIVKISDFGVSYAVSSDAGDKSDLELAKTVGTPAFFSPELCIPTELRENGERKSPIISSKVDIWAFGVTLFCFLYGYLPFEADNEYELFRVIANNDIEFPDPKEDEDLAMANDLLRKLLTKNSCDRPPITEVKSHPWFVKNLSPSSREAFLHEACDGSIEVSTEEVHDAVKGASIRNRIKQRLSRIAEQMKPNSKSKMKLFEETNRIPVSQLSAAGKNRSSNGESTSKGCLALSKSSSISPISDQSSQTLPRLSRKLSGDNCARRGSLNSFTDHSLDSLGSNSSLENIQSYHYCHPQQSHTTSNEDQSSTTSMGLMPMSQTVDSSLASKSNEASIERLNLSDPSEAKLTPILPKHLNTQLPELELPKLDNDSLWGQISSSSSDDDEDSGELTLVIGRDRTRSIERGAKYASHS